MRLGGASGDDANNFLVVFLIECMEGSIGVRSCSVNIFVRTLGAGYGTRGTGVPLFFPHSTYDLPPRSWGFGTRGGKLPIDDFGLPIFD